MDTLSRYIEELIMQHDCVIVPGLGGFITYREGAKIDGNRIHPPLKKIRFNSRLNYNDGLLCEKYMTDRGLTYTESIKAIEAEVDAIKEHLSVSGLCNMGALGALRKFEDGTIAVECDDVSFLPENYGLKTIAIDPAEKATRSDKTIILQLPHSTGNILRYAAAIVAVSIITLFVPHSTTDTIHEATLSFDTLYKTTYIAPQNQQPTEAAEAMPVSGASLEYTEPAADTVPNNTPTLTATDSKVTTPEKNKYHLIVASLGSYELAKQYIAEQNKYDREELRIISDGKKHRVSAKSFPTYKAAISYADSIRESRPDMKAWVLCE